MSAFLPGWWGWWLHSAAGGSALLLAAWLAARLIRQPARRQRLAECGAAAALLVPLIALFPAWIVVPVAAPEAPTLVAVERHPEAAALPVVLSAPEPMSADSRIVSEPAEGDWLDLAAVTPPAEPPQIQAAVPPPEHKDEQSDVTPTAPAGFDSTTVVIGWYAAGVLFFVARWLLGTLALMRLVRQSSAAPAEIMDFFATMTVHWRRPPRLLVCDRLVVPVSFGIVRPTVMLSPAVCRPGAEAALRWVLAHELTHLERRDAWSSQLFALAQAVYFFVPWLWSLRRQVRLCQEYVADAAACSADAAVDYAQFLLNLRRAPALPGRALGVSGNPSDLYRRVTMLLQSSSVIERGCPRAWSLGAAAGLLGLAVFVSGLGFEVQANPIPQPAAPADKKEEPSKEAPKKDEGPLDPSDFAKEIQKIIGERGPGADPAEVQKRLAELMQRMQKLQQMQMNRAGVQVQPGNVIFNTRVARGGRLGATTSAPSAVLAEQLDLPRGKGLVIDHVAPDSAASKAGLKAHDILLQFDGKDVGTAADLHKILDGIKADSAVDAVVLRKGKKETVKGIKLPEADKVIQFNFAPAGVVPPFPPGVPGVPGAPAGPGVWVNPFGGPAGPMGGLAGNARGVMTSVFRTDDRFTTRHQEGTLVITLTGTVADGKSRVSEINVQDGAVQNKYESVDKVPEQYRDKVKNLLEMSEKNNGKIEIKKP